MKCINHSHAEYTALNEVVNDRLLLDVIINKWQEDNKSDAYPTVKEVVTLLNSSNIPYYSKDFKNGAIQFKKKDNEVDFVLRSVELLNSDKAKQVFAKGEKNKWDMDKILLELGIPKLQKQIILSSGKTNREEIITDLLANYSYTIEINTAKQEYDYGSTDPEYRLDGSIINQGEPTQHYSNLTVPGGTNYTENEIATPAIAPSIKGHAEFATDNGIGWFRSDEEKPHITYAESFEEIKDLENKGYQKIGLTDDGSPQFASPNPKIRRILEVQSDLFQKGRDEKDLVAGRIGDILEGGSGINDDILDEKDNNFLQLLNKDNNWVTFFVKSIIQDSAKKGYEKVLFPTGNTASKVEGHTTLEEFKKQKEDRIKELEEILKNLENDDVQGAYDFSASSNSGKWNSANNELLSLVQDNRKAFAIYKFLIGDMETFKEIVDFLNERGIEIPYTDRMRRADETMTAEEKQSAIDSYNNSVSEKTDNKNQVEKDVLSENNLQDETEYTPEELIEKYPLTGVQKVIWNLIKDVVNKLGIKVKFSSSRITEGFDGSNNPQNGEILIRPSTLKNGRFGEVLVHEVVHALTTKIISRVNSGVTSGLTQKQINAVKGLMKLFEAVKADNNLDNKYPVKDVFEFIAHLTNEAFVKELESKDKNFLQKVVDFILDILGINNANELSKKYLLDIISDGTFLQENGITVLPSDYGNNLQGSKSEEIQNIKNEIAQLKQELERVEREGFGALKPIFNFYENTVTNILKKQGYNAKVVTDEYGNTWNEVTIDTTRDLNTIALKQISEAVDRFTLNKETVVKLADRLKRRTGVDYEVVSASEAIEMLKEISTKKYTVDNLPAGFYKNGGIVFVEDRLTDDLVWHEFAHPIIDAIYKDNPRLFNNLYNELDKSPEGKEIIARVKALYDNLEENSIDFKKECVVTAIGYISADKFTSKQSKGLVAYLQELLREISGYLKFLLKNNITPNTLRSNELTLSDISDLMVSGQGKFNIGFDSDGSTQFKNSSIKPTINTSKEWSGDLKSRPVYTAEGVNTMRTESAKANEHFGNPFSASGYSGTIKVPDVATAVKAYKDWLLTGYAQWLDSEGSAEDFAGNVEQRKWILDQINQGKLDGATLLYAGKLANRGQGMHPTALAEVVEELRSTQFKNTQPSTSVKEGVSELFESNPELANAVYEALGFNNSLSLKDVLKEYTVEELKQGVTLRSLQNKIEEKDFETIKRAYNYLKSEEKYRRIKNSNEQIESKLEKLREELRQTQETKVGSVLTITNDENASDYRAKVIEINKYSDYAILKVKTEKNKEYTIRVESDGSTKTGYIENFVFNSTNVESAESIKSEINNLKSQLQDLKSDYSDYYIDYFENNNQITPQQKQQAQQQYSQYLDTVLPNSQVKYLVYILGNEEYIEGFKNFVTKPSTSSNVEQLSLNFEESETEVSNQFTQDQLKDITEQLAYAVLSKVDNLEETTVVDYTMLDRTLASLRTRAEENEDLELLARVDHVIANSDFFKDKVRAYIKAFGFSEDEYDIEDDNGNIVPVNTLTVSDLKDAPSRVKLLVALLPTRNMANSYLGLPKMANFQESWNTIKDTLADLPMTNEDGEYEDGVDLMISKLYDKSATKPHFKILADKLVSTNTSELLKTQFFNTFNGTKINYSTTLIDKSAGITVRIANSNLQSKGTTVRDEWESNFVDKMVTFKDGVLFYNELKLKGLATLLQTIKTQLDADRKNGGLISKKTYTTLRLILSTVGIDLSNEALDYAIESQNKDTEAAGLTSLIYNPKTGIFNALKSIVEKAGQPLAASGTKFKTELSNQSSILRLAGYEAEFRTDLGQAQVLGPDGNAYGLFSKNNALTQLLQEYKNNPTMLEHVLSTAYSASSRWGKWMLEDPNNAKNLSIVVLNNYKELGKSDKGDSISDLKEGDTYTNVIDRTLKGNFIGLAEADKGNQFTFSGPPVEKSDVRGDLNYLYMEDDNAVNILMDYLKDELTRCSLVFDQLYGENKLDKNELIQHYHYSKKPGDGKANGLKLYLFPNLDLQALGLMLPNGRVAGLTNENFFNNEALKEAVKQSFLNIVKKDIIKCINKGIIDSELNNIGIDNNTLNKYSHDFKVTNAIADFTLNSIIGNIEQTKLFNGDPALYKTDKKGNRYTDITKRVPALIAQGTSLRVYKDLLGNDVVRERYSSAVVANIEAPSAYFIKDGEVKPEIVDEIYKALNTDGEETTTKQQIIDSLLGYKDVNRTDAQAWITIDLYKERLNGFGKWTDAHEEAFNAIKAGKPITAGKAILFMQPLKTVHVERIYKNGAYILHYNKQSEAVLHPFLINGTKLNNLAKAMETNKTDHVITLDGKKVGAFGIANILDDNGNIKDADDIEFTNVRLSNRYVFLQQDLKAKGLQDTLVASQPPKVVLTDVQLDKIYKINNTEAIKGKDGIQELNDVTSELSNIGLAELQEELGANPFVDERKFTDKLIETLEESDTSQNFIDGLKEGLPIDSIPGLRNTTQNKTMAMTRNSTVKLKQLGASLIQMSDFGFVGVEGEDVNTSIIWFKDPTEDLLPTRIENGKTRPSQLLIPYTLISKIPGWRTMTPKQLKEAIDPDCLKGFSYRIPNQGHSSNDVFEIVGILPESCGDVMIAYKEITKKTGSDFDIDKNYIILPAVEFDAKSGKLRKIQYNKDRPKNDPYYKKALQNRRLDLMMALLGDAKTYFANMSPLDDPWLPDACARLYPEQAQFNDLEFFTGTHQADIKMIFDSAKTLVGVVANHLSDHGNSQSYNLSFNIYLGKGNLSDNKNSAISKIYGETGVAISKVLNAYANGILDAAKDPYITRANINNITAPVAFMLIRCGYDPNWVVAFIGQPIIKQFVEESAKRESRIFKPTRNAKGKVVKALDVVLNGQEVPKIYDIPTVKQLEDNLKTPSKLLDLDVLAMFLRYQESAKDLSASIRISKQDVNGGGKSLAHANALNNDIIKLVNKKTIVNLDKKLGLVIDDETKLVEVDYDGLPVMNGSTMLSTYHENSVNQSIKLFSDLFITESRAFKATLHNTLTMQGLENSVSNIELIDKIVNETYSYLLSNVDSGLTISNYSDLFLGNNSIAHRLKDIKNEGGALSNNLLISNLTYYIPYINTLPSFIGINNAKKIDKDSRNSLYLAWEELDKQDPKLSEDLAKYAYYASGFNKTLTSFYDMIPISVLKKLNFVNFIKSQNLLGEDSMYLNKAAVQVIKNLHDNTKLVPVIPFVDPYGKMPTDQIFVLGTKLKDDYRIADLNNHSEHKRFLKYKKKLYKLAGYTPSGDNPVYVRTNLLGYTDGKYMIKEYFFDKPSNTSIIPENNISLRSDVLAIIGDVSNLTPPTTVSKVDIKAKPERTEKTEEQIEKEAKEAQKKCK